MTDRLAEAYHCATLTRDEKFLSARSKLIKTLVNKLTPAGALELVRVYQDLPGYDRGSLAELFDAVKDPGPQYARPEVTLELRILAGASLGVLLTTSTQCPDKTTDLAALALLCCRIWQPVAPRPPTGTFDPNQASAKHLAARGVAVRKLPSKAVDFAITLPELSLPAIALKAKKIEVSPSFQISDAYGNRERTVKSTFDFEVDHLPAVALQRWMEAVQRHMMDTANRIAVEASRLIEVQVANLPHLQGVLQEENNILWWLFGGASNACGLPFSQLSPEAACIAAAMDLDALTCIVPGLVAAPAFLDRALRSSRDSLPDSVSVAAVGATELCLDWLKTRPALADLCPVSSILDGSPKTHPSGSFAQTVSPLELAYQTYLELQLQRLHVEVAP